MLNFLVARAIIPQLLQAHHGSLRNLAADSRAASNRALLGTVIYWVTRAAFTKAFPGLPEGSLQAGDKHIKEQLVHDDELSHVLKELWRIGWMRAQRDLLLEVVDRVWEKACEMEPALGGTHSKSA